MESHTIYNKKIIGIILGVAGLVAVLVISIINTRKSGDTTPVATESGSASVLPPLATTPPVDVNKKGNVIAVSVYRNGTYTATGSYMSPGGEDQLGVTLTLKDDVITDVSVTLGANDHRSLSFQNIFAENYKQYVVGKNITGLYLNAVSGSSLTPRGFNDALEKIKAQARA